MSKKRGAVQINPLVLVQLPNDDHARKETLDKSKLEIVKDFLRDKGIDEKDIAIWLSDKKFKGGIISKVAEIWNINNNDEYKADANYTEWINLSEIL